MTHPLIDKARAYATDAHKGQVRKYTREPYIVHPIAVADLVAAAHGTPEMIAAALLHDVVEDCGIPHSAIWSAFGGHVSGMVWWLTNKAQPWDGNRAQRKAINTAHIALAPAHVKTIKLADIVDNTRSTAEHDPKFWKVYQAEKQAQLRVLTAGDDNLWQRAAMQLGMLPLKEAA